MTILKIISLLDKDLKRKFVFLSVFVFISMLLEILSIGMILPLISSFLEPDLLLNKARSVLGIEFKTTIKLTIVALVFILFASSSTNLIANYIPTQNVLINFWRTKRKKEKKNKEL